MRPETETIWTNARIRTMDPARPLARAMLVRGGKIVRVGDDGDIAAAAGAGARKIDLGGRFVMPGLIDSHTHALWGGRRDLFECFVGYAATLDQLLGAVAARAEKLPLEGGFVGSSAERTVKP